MGRGVLLRERERFGWCGDGGLVDGRGGKDGEIMFLGILIRGHLGWRECVGGGRKRIEERRREERLLYGVFGIEDAIFVGKVDDVRLRPGYVTSIRLPTLF